MNGPHAKLKKKNFVQKQLSKAENKRQKTKAFKNFLFYKISVVSAEL